MDTGMPLEEKEIEILEIREGTAEREAIEGNGVVTAKKEAEAEIVTEMKETGELIERVEIEDRAI